MMFTLLMLACTGGEAPEATTPEAPATSPSTAGALTLIYTNNVQGEIEPCG